MFATHPDKLSALTHLPGFSDHVIIAASYQAQLTPPITTKKKLTLYDRGNYDAINDELINFCSVFLEEFHSRSVETNWSLFKNTMQQLIEKYVPTITITEQASSPWFNRTLKRLNNKKKRLFRIAKKKNFHQCWSQYRTAEKKFESLAAKTKRAFYSTTLPNMLRNNPRQFWKTINPKPRKSISLCDNNFPIPDHLVAETLNTTFCADFTEETGD